MRTRLRRPGREITLADIEDLVGDCDLAGDATVAPRQPRPPLTATLRARASVPQRDFRAYDDRQVQALGVLAGEDRPVPIRCAAIALDADGGRLTPTAFPVDTEDSIITATGNADLVRERLGLTLDARFPGPEPAVRAGAGDGQRAAACPARGRGGGAGRERRHGRSGHRGGTDPRGSAA